MPLRPTPFLRHGLTVAGALVACSLLADLTQAQALPDKPQQRRLVLDIELKRQGPVQHGIEHGEQSLSQRWQFSALLETDGSPAPYNPLDPADAQRQLADGQRQAAAVRGATPAAAPDVAALQAQAQALQARCGQDSACLMREASALAAAGIAGGAGGAGGGRRSVDPALQARLKSYGEAAAACERQPAGRAREACQAEARRRAGGGDEGPADGVLPTPYLVFNGIPVCDLQLAGRIDERIQGRYNDTYAVVQTRETAVGQDSRRDDQWCPSLIAVLDTRNGRVWASLNLVPRSVQGWTTREESNRPGQRREGLIELRWWEATDWVAQRLLRLSASGQDQAVLPAGAGQAEIRMSWRFKPS